MMKLGVQIQAEMFTSLRRVSELEFEIIVSKSHIQSNVWYAYLVRTDSWDVLFGPQVI